MEKEKLTQKQADALEYALKLPAYPTKQHFIMAHAEALLEEGSWAYECKELNEVDLWTMSKVLVNGYEIERTPEDKVRELYEGEIKYRERNGHENLSSIGAIRKTLDLLNIKIKGVNE